MAVSGGAGSNGKFSDGGESWGTTDDDDGDNVEDEGDIDGNDGWPDRNGLAKHADNPDRNADIPDRMFARNADNDHMYVVSAEAGSSDNHGGLAEVSVVTIENKLVNVKAVL